MLCGVQSLCSWSLVELYRALESSVEAHKAVLAAHPMYANLMERAIAKVVLQHVTTLEKFCQVRTLQLTRYPTAQACCIYECCVSPLGNVCNSLCILLPCCSWTVQGLHAVSVISGTRILDVGARHTYFIVSTCWREPDRHYTITAIVDDVHRCRHLVIPPWHMPPRGSNLYSGMSGMSVMQAELPNSQSNKIIQPLRALKNRQAVVPLGQGPPDGAPGASTRLCAYLNDMRELRTKQGELTAAFKACVPPAWWGTDAGFKSQLGDRFKMCQVMPSSIASRFSA